MPSRLRQFVRRLLQFVLPSRWFLVRGDRRSNSICLTFDDGPHPVHTPQVLDVLRALNVPATFFVVGKCVEENPDLVKRIVAEGHALGHHSFLHSNPSQTSASRLLSELRETQSLLRIILGRGCHFFRPPHGKLTVRKAIGLWREGQTIVLWNVDPKDFRCQSKQELSDWFRQHPLAGGDIVLFHDNQPHAAGTLAELVGECRNRGLEFTTPASWLPPSSAGSR